MTWSPDGQQVVLDGPTGLEWWDAATARLLASARQPGGADAITFSPDGATYATSRWDSASARGPIDRGEVQLWSTATNDPVGIAFHHKDRVQGVSFSGDGRTLLTASDDRTARLWDVTTGLPLGPYLPHGHPVKCGTFLPDDRRVLVGCDDGTVQFWDVRAAWTRDPEQVRLGVEALTRMELEANDLFRVLKPDEWRQRRRAATGGSAGR